MSIHAFSRYRAVRLALLLPASLMIVGLASACGGDDDDDDDATATATTAAESPTSSGGNGNGDDDEGEPITIALKDNFFEPKEITIPVNTEVEITVNNEGTAVHNMHVLSKDQEGQDFTSDAIVTPGASSTFEVKFTKTGEYDFQCDYHLPDMVGVITVE